MEHQFVFKENYQQCVDLLNQWTEDYDKGAPVVEDYEWDDLYYSVQDFEYYNPELISPDSPTQKVHFVKVSELSKVKHSHPMLSLAKTKDLAKITEILGTDFPLIAMLKLDGLSCSLTYEKGVLVRAETRGDGVVGEDVTHNIWHVSTVPRHLPQKIDLTVDGEIIIKEDDFEPFAQEYKNPRNLAAGTIRLLDAATSTKRRLTFVAWDAFSSDEDEFTNLSDKLRFLQDSNFIVTRFRELSGNASNNKIQEAIDSLRDVAKVLDFPIDGIVFKIDNTKEYAKMGRTDHHFKGGVAFKFFEETYGTNLLDVSFDVSRTGELTPVAVFSPVKIGIPFSLALLALLDLDSKSLQIKRKVELETESVTLPPVSSILFTNSFRFLKSSSLPVTTIFLPSSGLGADFASFADFLKLRYLDKKLTFPIGYPLRLSPIIFPILLIFSKA